MARDKPHHNKSGRRDDDDRDHGAGAPTFDASRAFGTHQKVSDTQHCDPLSIIHPRPFEGASHGRGHMSITLSSGTSNDDILTGTDGSDVLLGNNGDDVIDGGDEPIQRLEPLPRFGRIGVERFTRGQLGDVGDVGHRGACGFYAF